MFDNEICDARFSKCCGGISEDFENVWQPVKVPYLVAIRDVDNRLTETSKGKNIDTESFITTSPEAFCNTTDSTVLSQVLIDFDRSTTNFYRWTVEYEQETISALIAKKSGIEFGEIADIVPLERGNSGRIIRLKIIGTKKKIIVGKELEIRKWLSESHLYSSAFVVEKEFENNSAIPSKFILRGAGWGHGVGMCQIGAAMMSKKGYTSDEILKHYFKETEVKKIY
jgi:SpoIID/LytB domain protein